MYTVQTLISTARGGLSGWLEDMVVTRRRRGRGIGRALLEAAQEGAVSRNLTRLQLLAELDNQAALRFYSGLGWRRTQLLCFRRQPP